MIIIKYNIQSWAIMKKLLGGIFSKIKISLYYSEIRRKFAIYHH